MLAIRMQRTGRRGHAQFRVVVQDTRFTPKSGRVVAYLGVYNPHTKNATLDGEKVGKYLDNGAQPTDRVVRILQNEGIKLPEWVKTADPKKRAVRNPEKRRSTTPTQTSEEEVSAGKPKEEVPAQQPETPDDSEATEAVEDTSSSEDSSES